MKCWLVIFTMLLPVSAVGADAVPFDHKHQGFSQILSNVVEVKGHQSRVDYPKLLPKREALAAYLTSIRQVGRKQFDTFSKDQQLAFLINAYNGFQLQLVVDHYPIESIKDVGSFFRSPWSLSFFNLFGKPATLDKIEHEMIRAWFEEPRIHFAVNCASISCPPLQAEAYIAERLDAQLEQATVNFLNDLQANQYNPKTNTLTVSKIFSWYEEDFGGDVPGFVLPRMRGVNPEKVDRQGLTLRYSNYNWQLNAATAR